MRTPFLVALFLGAIVAACSPGTSAGLIDKEWQLTAITEKVPAFQGVIPAEDQPRYTITFKSDLTWSGAADCNRVAGTYKTPASNGLTIEVGLSTRAFCPEGSFADLYLHGLAQARTYAIAADVLTITLEDEGTMVFSLAAATPSAATSAETSATPAATGSAPATSKPTAAPTAKPTAKPTAAATAKPSAAPTAAPTASTGLIGKTWQLTTITEKNPAFQGEVPASQQANYTITFVADGTFSAKADCNNVTGTYTASDATAASGALAIAPGPTTTVACPDGSLSDLYILGLGNAASYAIASGGLTITLADQGTLVYK